MNVCVRPSLRIHVYICMYICIYARTSVRNYVILLLFLTSQFLNKAILSDVHTVCRGECRG